MNAAEKERFTIMENEIKHIKIDVTDIKGMLKEHVDWETEKYEKLDTKYVHKEEFIDFKEQMKEDNQRQDKEINSTKKRVWEVAKQVGLVAGVGAMFTKSVGVW